MPLEERAPVEFRDQYGTVADVNVSQRIIDLVVVPYNEDTTVEYRGQMITESFLPGSFAGLDAVPGRVTANRDHKVERAVGIAKSIDTAAADGLIASVKVSSTLLGDETLELARDEVLMPSVGFGARQRDQRWSEGNRRRQIIRAFLDHIALVPQQAYAGARVLAVRSDHTLAVEEPPAIPLTPRLDEVLRYTAHLDEQLRAARNA